MSPAAKAALIATLLALAGCKDINDGIALLSGKPTADDVVLKSAETPLPAPEPVDTHSPELMYLPAHAPGEFGEVYATGWNCTAIYHVRICT